MTEEFRDVDVEQQIGELVNRISELRDQCRYRSSSRISRELKRFAKAEKQVIPYLDANFYLMNDAQYLLDVETGIEVSVESIAYLESEEKARQLQPDFPEDRYHYVVSVMSSCAYDNLAKHTAKKEGYNSDGVHDCIAEGIHVCQRTGKLECVTCFREYATNVYRASDDLDMALHYARMISGNTPLDSDNDRRWVGSKDACELLLVNGDLAAAKETVIQALKLAKHYHMVLVAQMETAGLLAMILELEGTAGELPELLSHCGVDPSSFPEIEVGECPSLELQLALQDAVKFCCQGEHLHAISLLTDWDRRLLSSKCLSDWFELRLRLTAILRLAGMEDKAQALAKQLKPKAHAARDWLTLRRLQALTNGEVKPNPLASLVPLRSGIFAETSANPQTQSEANPTSAAVQEVDQDHKPARDASQSGEEITPLKSQLDQFVETLQESGGEEEVCRSVQQKMLAYKAEDVSHASDAARLIQMAHAFSSLSENAELVWDWAQPFLEKFSQDASVINMVADLGDTARETTDDDPDEIAALDYLESLMVKSLDLDPNHAGNFARAGAFFLQHGELGEAERCYARSFRLDRTRGDVALRLADIYNETDRARDGLEVLDLCIRNGSEDPAIYWQAGQIAFHQEKYDWVLTYYNRLETLCPERAWVQFYLAWALWETGKPEDALKALESESLRNADCHYHVDALRACIFGAEGKQDLKAFSEKLQTVLSQKLSKVDSLSQPDILRLFQKLSAAVVCLPEDHEARKAFNRLSLQLGMAADELFEPHREQEPLEEGINYYVVFVRQLLDENWPQHPGCLFGQDQWPAYIARWGVLARDEEEAVQWVRKWQSQCYPLDMEVLEVSLQTQGYRESPGIVWQGMRQPPFLPLDDDEDFDDEFDEDFDDDFEDDDDFD